MVLKVIIGTVAVHNPDSKLDPPPFEKLDQACILFHKAAETSSRAQRALVSLNFYTCQRKKLMPSCL